jgi:hypothetical protein
VLRQDDRRTRRHELAMQLLCVREEQTLLAFSALVARRRAIIRG